MPDYTGPGRVYTAGRNAGEDKVRGNGIGGPMRLYIVRHAEAIERGGTVPESHRYLTPKGRDYFRKTSRQMIRKGAIPDCILSSPLIRAVQTADILAEEIGFRGPLIVTDKLAPGFGRAGLRVILSKCADAKEVALVGHEPDLGDLVTSLLSLKEPYTLKKGEAVALNLPGGGALSPADFLWSAAGKKIVRKAGK
jgi:phosphohistidine phosphatase